MSNKEIADRFAIALVTVLSMLLVFMFGACNGVDSGVKRTQHEAVKAGAAEYYLDSNHQRQFRWRTNAGGVKP